MCSGDFGGAAKAPATLEELQKRLLALTGKNIIDIENVTFTRWGVAKCPQGVFHYLACMKRCYEGGRIKCHPEGVEDQEIIGGLGNHHLVGPAIHTMFEMMDLTIGSHISHNYSSCNDNVQPVATAATAAPKVLERLTERRSAVASRKKLGVPLPNKTT